MLAPRSANLAHHGDPHLTSFWQLPSSPAHKGGELNSPKRRTGVYGTTPHEIFTPSPHRSQLTPAVIAHQEQDEAQAGVGLEAKRCEVDGRRKVAPPTDTTLRHDEDVRSGVGGVAVRDGGRATATATATARSSLPCLPRYSSR